MKKRLCWLVVILVLSFSSLVAAKAVTLDLWITPFAPREELFDLVGEFNASQEDIEIELNVLDWGTGRERIRQAVASGRGPDLFFIGTGLDQSYIDANLLLPLEDAGFTTEELAVFNDLIEANRVSGKTLAAPLLYETYVLFYRTDILADYGYETPPADWAELKSMAADITERSNGKIMGYQHKGPDDHLNAINLTWPTFLYQAGGQVVDRESMTSSLDTPEGREALEYMYSFYQDKVSTVGPSASAGFREGKVAMYIFNQTPIHSEEYAFDPEMEGKWAVAPLPMGPINGGGYVGGHSVAINATTKYPQEAGTFLRWFASPKQTLWIEYGYGIPVFDLDKLDADSKADIQAILDQDPDTWAAILEQLNRCDPNYMVDQRYGNAARSDAQKRYIMGVMTGDLSIEKALESIDREVNQSMQ